MKKLKIFSVFPLLAMSFCFLIFSFSHVWAEENTVEKRFKECVDSCDNKGKVCVNMTADPRRCMAIVQECVDACKAEAESSQSQN